MYHRHRRATSLHLCTGLTPGTHTVTVTDANLCETTCEIIINEPIELQCSISLVNDISCFGANDGSATVSASGGTSGYLYLWDDNQTTQTAVNLTPGLHTVTVTDNSNCDIVCDIIIEEPTEFTCMASLIQTVQCAGDTDGSATVVSTGGISPFTYLWDNNETGQTAIALNGGQHIVTVTDATGCTSECSVIIPDVSGLSCSISIENDITCFGADDGSATVTATGGMPGYNYMWDNGDNTQTATALSPGFHEVTVTDSNGCATICSVDIFQPTIIGLENITAVTSLTCSGNDDGTATVNAVGGTPSYTYLWSNGEVTQSAIALPAGEGTVTITDANLCTLVDTFTIEQANLPNVDFNNISPIICDSIKVGSKSGGSASALVSGGNPGYTYLWSTGETTQSANSLVAGQNFVTVTDAFGCQTVAEIDIPLEDCFFIDLEKSGQLVNPNELIVVGSQIQYNFNVCNTGTVELKIVTISDMLVTVLGGPISLVPGECDNTSFVGMYSITQEDIDLREVENSAIAMGLSDTPDSTPAIAMSDDPSTSEVDDPTIFTLASPSINLDKEADISGLQDPPEPGDVINYIFTICNTGDLQLTNVTVIDPPIELIGSPIPVLNPEECNQVAFSGSYDITATDISLGSIENTAMVTAIDPDGNVIRDRSDDPTVELGIDPNNDGNPDDPTIVTLEAFPQIELFKVGEVMSDCPTPGNLIAYRFEVCNTGNVDLINVRISDPMTTVIGDLISIAAGECDNNSFIASYSLTQADIDNGVVINSATVTANDLNEVPVMDISDDPNIQMEIDIENDGEPDDPTETFILQKENLTLVKTGVFNDENGDGIAQPGETVSYSFIVQNNGNVTLNNIILDDPLLTISGGPIPTLAVGEVDSTSFSGSYILRVPDIEVAMFENTAFVSGESQIGNIATAAASHITEYVVRSCDEIICNNDLQISLGDSCRLLLTEDQLIEDPVIGNYMVNLFEDDEPFGEGGLLTQESVGKTLKFQVSCGLNSCWGTLTVEANKIPDFDALCAIGPNGEINPDCEFFCAGDVTPGEIVSIEEMNEIFASPCTPNLVSDLIVNESREGDLCSENGTVVTLEYRGKFNLHGSVTEKHILTQSYVTTSIPLEEVIFPEDILDLNCNTQTNPQFLSVLRGNLGAFPTVSDENFVPVGDSILFCDSLMADSIIIGERDIMQLQIIDGKEFWIQVTVVEKEFIFTTDSSSCRTILDPESIIRENYIAIDDKFCNLVSSFSDLEYSNCGNTKRILREWQVIDWCNADLSSTDVQTIETKDFVPPQFTDLFSDKFVNIEPWSCTGSLLLPPMNPGINFLEICGGNVDVNWDAEEGRIVDGRLVDLWFTNDPIVIRVTLTDECGNLSSRSFRVIMQDMTRPVMVCNPNIQVQLTGTTDNGIATLFASDLDEGSHDAGCGLVDLKVVRAEDYLDPVFDCEDNLIGFQPVTCGVQIDSVFSALVSGFEKDPDCKDSLSNIVTLAGNFVSFCCEDVGQSVEVILIATDKHGNTNQCVVEVLVGERIPPRLSCPELQIDCNDGNMELPAIVGSICAIEEYEPILVGEVNDPTICLDASVIREWYLDINANGELDENDPYCQQTISIDGEGGTLNPFLIKWPKNYDGITVDGINIECDDEGNPQEMSTQVTMGQSMECLADAQTTGPVWCQSNCSLVGSSVSIDTINSSEACLTFIKKWTVVDWCTWNADQSNIDDENDSSSDTFIAVEDWAQFDCVDCMHSNVWDESVYMRYKTVDRDGYYTYDQLIRIEDRTSPEISAPLDFIVNTTNGAADKDDESLCIGSDIISVSASDTCGGESVSNDNLSWTIVVQKDGIEIATKTAKGEEVFMNTQEGQPGDIHQIIWIVSDACGNQTSLTTTVEFGDESAPSPFCLTALTSNLPDEEGEVLVWANEFDFGSFDNCTATDQLIFSIVPEGQDPIQPGDDGFENQHSYTSSCAPSNQSVQLDMWVWDISGNGDHCTVQFFLSESCVEEEVGSGATIAGFVKTEYNASIDKVAVELSSTLAEYPKVELTNEIGQYTFANNPSGFNYSISPHKDGNDANGISTADLVLIQRQVLGIGGLETPYQVIAADANADQKLSAADIVTLRKLILGFDTELENTNSWRFVDQSQSFISYESPWPFIEQISVVDLGTSFFEYDFVGVKIGDVNHDATINGVVHSEIREDFKPFILTANDVHLSKGEITELSIYPKANEELLGIQFTLNHAGLEVLDIQSESVSVTKDNYATFGEYSTFSWNAEKQSQLNFNHPLLVLKLRATDDLAIADVLAISSDKTKSEAYRNNVSYLSDVVLHFTDNNFELYQNQPNPFDQSTIISFNLPHEASVSINIYTVEGQVVKAFTGEFMKGYNEFSVNRESLSAGGIFYYKIETEFGIKTMKMLVLD